MIKITKTQKLELTKLWRNAVMRTHCEICATTGKFFPQTGEGKLEAAHIIPKGHHLFTFHPLNGLSLCVYHHKHCKLCSPHSGLQGFERWLMMFRAEKFKWYMENKNRVGYTGYEEFKKQYIEVKQ